MRIFPQGLWVRGCPWTTDSRRIFSRLFMSKIQIKFLTIIPNHWINSMMNSLQNGLQYLPDFFNQINHQFLPLCLKTFILAPDNLAPRTREEWFNSSLTIKSPFPTRVGMLVEFVAKPIPKAIAAGLLRNRATRASSSSWMWRVPGKETKSSEQLLVRDSWRNTA